MFCKRAEKLSWMEARYDIIWAYSCRWAILCPTWSFRSCSDLKRDWYFVYVSATLLPYLMNSRFSNISINAFITFFEMKISHWSSEVWLLINMLFSHIALLIYVRCRDASDGNFENLIIPYALSMSKLPSQINKHFGFKTITQSCIRMSHWINLLRFSNFLWFF